MEALNVCQDVKSGYFINLLRVNEFPHRLRNENKLGHNMKVVSFKSGWLPVATLQKGGF